jgi:diguanylate cyclase (GGDEF)-like protein
MLWRRKQGKDEAAADAEPAAASTSGRSPEAELDRALDAVGALLRTFGKLAFDMPEQTAKDTCESCEQWAQHLIVRATHPAERGGESRGSAERDWSGAVRFFTDTRRAENHYLQQTLHDFRLAIWEFVTSLHHALLGDAESDAHVRQHLLRLRDAAENPSTDALKREAISVAGAIAQVLEERQQRQRSQATELGARVAALARELEEARRESAIDALTGLYNRRAFDEQAARAATLYSIVEQPLSIVLFDIDHFKNVNDTYGHPVGDEVLRRVSRCLVGTFLRRDDFLARYGGEEMAVVLRDTRIVDAQTVTERMLKAVRGLAFEHAGKSFGVTVSAGVAQFQPGETQLQWIARADRALYAAKAAGRDRVCAAPAGEPETKPATEAGAAPA